ncbi:thioredoxin reductase [Candidatus Saccharibacteria bacterium oral taxon 955]|nr:thioredoxin reductase [Candidatus Saccharibacteria bacterium oral taxon 955]QJU05960.1 thioredoxin reductase [Candidatus Saccharibacteria bacterium oral taxon 955]
MQQEVKSVVMVGAGPSALTAAIYTTREDIDTTLYEKGVVGGLAAITDRVDNYPGFPDGVEGMTLADRLQRQAERFGAKIEYGNVSAIRHEDGVNILMVDGNEVRAKAVLIATGSDYNKLNIPGEAEYYGRGVHYCATCDGAFYRDKRLVVVGGGNSGVQEAIFLTRFASHIDLLVRSTVKASQVLQDDLKKYIDDGKVTIHLETVPTEIVADNTGKVTAVKATKAGEATEFMVDGVFIFIGLKPNTQFLEGSGVELDERRLIKTDDHLATSLPGVFASGDVRSGATMQVASAVGEGATAALSIREYLESQALSK